MAPYRTEEISLAPYAFREGVCGHANCKGHAFVTAAHKAFDERGGERMGFVQFYRQRVAPNDLVARVLAAQWADVQGF